MEINLHRGSEKVTFKYTRSNAYPHLRFPSVSLIIIFFFPLYVTLLIPPDYLFKFFIFLKCNPLLGYVCLVLVALYKYFYFVVNPFNLYIQFLLNPQEDLIIISTAHVCFPLGVLGKKQFPVIIPDPYLLCFPSLLEITLKTSSLFQPTNFIKSQFSSF